MVIIPVKASRQLDDILNILGEYEFCTGEEAIRGVTAVRPDMLIMDIQLAGVINGIEAVAEIRNHQVIPVIYDSVNPAMLAREQQRPPGAKFLSKPVTCSQLERAIKQLAGTRRTGNPGAHS